MQIEELIIKFKQMGYESMEFELFHDELTESGMQMWVKESRVIFLKEYEAKSLFLDWYISEQPIIASIYNYLPSNYKNNIYFFMILNFDLSKDEGLALSINKVVKDEYVCKKYVFQSVDEITDVPFLSDQFIKMPQFDYDQEFKSGILNFNTINELTGEEKEDLDSFYSLANNLLDYYFTSYSVLEETSKFEKDILKIGNRSVINED
ncbi:ABC-three component system middle component 1 [Pontibacillus litoralis]|uniref:Uncharacterized protein n=1 Tax=Pontibacillus litoralis JSM 072002 TaxID=1385512 RepID=A0A0A5G1E0_9BACI|nr:ABC-three component system middle component 1 [Pontibacillus litoralis]KGX84918.1 hypothetical protein N784_11650 [Pontibacillus litoralis JSM 072002]